MTSHKNLITFDLEAGVAQHNLGPKAKNLCGAFNM